MRKRGGGVLQTPLTGQETARVDPGCLATPVALLQEGPWRWGTKRLIRPGRFFCQVSERCGRAATPRAGFTSPTPMSGNWGTRRFWHKGPKLRCLGPSGNTGVHFRPAASPRRRTAQRASRNWSPVAKEGLVPGCRALEAAAARCRGAERLRVAPGRDHRQLTEMRRWSFISVGGGERGACGHVSRVEIQALPVAGRAYGGH